MKKVNAGTSTHECVTHDCKIPDLRGWVLFLAPETWMMSLYGFACSAALV